MCFRGSIVGRKHQLVRSDTTSREFMIGKGTKQGDPISPMLFNAVLEQVMRKVKAKWGNKYGISVGSGQDAILTNLRFADDIVLIGRSLPQIKKMIADVKSAGAEDGQELHPAKTKIQHNNTGYGGRVRSANIDGMEVEVLDPGATTMYLGRSLSMTDVHDSELRHRIAKAWAKFGTYSQELTDKTIPLIL